MHFGFSYTGLIFIVMLTVPNLFWTKNKPKDYEEYARGENRVLLIFERIGEVLVTCLLLIFSDFNVQSLSPRLIWLVLAFILMIMYEVFWVRYFKSERTMKDFYRSLMGIPVAGAMLPVAACCFVAAYGKNPFLFAAAVILGIGHIGIHINHKKEL